jgi:hypothetical protein
MANPLEDRYRIHKIDHRTDVPRIFVDYTGAPQQGAIVDVTRTPDGTRYTGMAYTPDRDTQFNVFVVPAVAREHSLGLAALIGAAEAEYLINPQERPHGVS